MRRIALILAAVLVPATPAQAGGPAAADVLTCERGAATFEARMDAVPGASRMSMRFSLHARTRRGLTRVAADGFDTWTTADPGVARYVFTRRVEELIAPARYRVQVRFRWQDAAGRTVARARRRSRACRQPDGRPNLRVVDVRSSDGGYVVLVRNTGRGAAGGFGVRIGTAQAWVDGLAARSGRWVPVAAAPCEPGAEVLAEADPEDRVAERSERDNAHAVACP